LKLLREEFELKIKEMREYNKKEFKRADVRMEVIEESIKQEIKDRIVESDE
jgi:hypothetical protein